MKNRNNKLNYFNVSLCNIHGLSMVYCEQARNKGMLSTVSYETELKCIHNFVYFSVGVLYLNNDCILFCTFVCVTWLCCDLQLYIYNSVL